MKTEILIVDDEDDIRGLIQGILEDEGYATRQAANSDQAYAAVKEAIPSLVILDIWLQGSQDDGLDILRELKDKHESLPVVMISGHGTIETAVSALKDGAYDFVEKPFKTDRLLLTISRALENAKLRRENAVLKKHAQSASFALGGSSPLIQAILQTIERVAPTNSRVLLNGEPGTGKDIAARMIHQKSQRAHEAFLALNCATLRPERLEIELFGSAGGRNGDEAEHIGILEQAHGGTLLLDEIADMPLETQGKIVRVLQEQRFSRVGEKTPIEVDVRVLATTNRDLEALMGEGRFRQDLFYRLNVVPIEMPPLRTRLTDIPELSHAFLESFMKQSGLAPRDFSQSTISALKNHKWPGNVRQLRNVVEWVVIMHGSQGTGDFMPEHLPPEFTGGSMHAGAENAPSGFLRESYLEIPLREAREEFEREYLIAQVERFDGNISKTAQFVGMERSALHRKLKSLNAVSEKGEPSAGGSAETRRKRA